MGLDLGRPGSRAAAELPGTFRVCAARLQGCALCQTDADRSGFTDVFRQVRLICAAQLLSRLAI